MPISESLTRSARNSADEAAPSLSKESRSPRSVSLRQFLESLLCLALAVIVFRTFQVEGYMISTGSMAPSLLGFHKQVVCPSCQFSFPFGVSYQSHSPRAITENLDESDFAGQEPGSRQLCTCPNCGQAGIDISEVPRNQGDQLLVFREAYWGRLPKRWEVIVFRNPYETTQAYVKRTAGLPGETIEIRAGDVYANGTLCRKNFAIQKAMRISVYDHDFEPDGDPAWQPRWQPDDDWEPFERGFGISADAPRIKPKPHSDDHVHGLTVSPEEPEWKWVTYGHFLRSGGKHQTSVDVPILDQPLSWPTDTLPAQYDVKTRKLSVFGVMSLDLRERLRKVSADPQYHEAVDRLYHRSHYAPVTDEYGYNRASHSSGGNAVRDVMLSLKLSLRDGSSAEASPQQFAVDMTDGGQTFRLLFDFELGEVHLLGNPERFPGRPPLRTAVLDPEWTTKPVSVEMSLFDRQVVAAVDGVELFDPWLMKGPRPEQESPRFPVRFGSRGISAGVDSLQLYRDVYYTSKEEDEPFTLKDDELYVLGDNSPVSLDSRRWKNGAVPLGLLLGKPFVVHLPSRQLRIRWGDSTRYIRIPDFSQVRYIR